jgi:hypothetical protein
MRTLKVEQEQEMPSERFGLARRTELAELTELARQMPSASALSWADVERIDEERLWWTMNALGRDDLMRLLARALGEVSAQRLEHVLGDHLRAADVGAPKQAPRQGVLAVVERFCSLAMRGHYCEQVDYRGGQRSAGTEQFVARFRALLDRCLSESATADAAEVSQAIEMLLDLMRRIDDDPDAIVCFADEAGSWQLRVGWSRLLPVYSRCLAQTLTPSEHVARVEAVVRDFGDQLGGAGASNGWGRRRP